MIRQLWKATSMRGFARNTSYLLASQVFGALTTLAFVPLLAHYLGLADYGRYAYVYAFVGLLENLSVFGLHHIFVREIARGRHRASLYLGNLLRVKAVLSLGTFGLVYLMALIFMAPDLRVLAMICASEVLLRKFFMVNLALSRAFERMEYDFWVTVVERSTALIGVLAVIKFDWGLTGVFLAFLAAAVVHALVSTLTVWRGLVRPEFTRVQGFGRLFLSNAWPVGLSRQSSVLYNRVGPVLLGQLHGPETVGIYSGAYRIYRIVNTVLVESVSRSALPVFSRLSLDSRSLNRFFLRVVFLNTVTGVAVSVFVWLLAPIAIPLLLGAEFESSVAILRLIAIAIPFTFLNAVLSAALQAVDRQQIDGFLTLGTFSINLVLNAVLIPSFGVMGAAWAFVAAEVFAFGTRTLACSTRGLSRSEGGALSHL